MKKLWLLIGIIILLVCGCDNIDSIEKYNDDILRTIEQEGREIAGYIEEYSYISEPGKIIGTYNMNEKDTLIFISKGEPTDVHIEDNSIFYNSDTYELYTQLKTTDGREFKKKYYIQGVIYQSNSDLESLSLGDGINNLFKLNDDENKNNYIAYPYNRICVNGHIFVGIGPNEGLRRYTYYGNEPTTLVKGICRRLQYKSGRIYYIKNHTLYSIKEDGKDNKKENTKDTLINKAFAFPLCKIRG